MRNRVNVTKYKSDTNLQTYDEFKCFVKFYLNKSIALIKFRIFI